MVPSGDCTRRPARSTSSSCLPTSSRARQRLPGARTAGDYIARAVQGRRAAAGRHRRMVPAVPADRRADVGQENTLSIESSRRTVNLALGTSYYPLWRTGERGSPKSVNRPARLPLVFAGYGLAVPERLRRLRAHRRHRQGRPHLQPRAAGARRQQPPERHTADAADHAIAKAALARSKGAKLCSSSATRHTASTTHRTRCSSDPDAEDLGIPS